MISQVDERYRQAAAAAPDSHDIPTCLAVSASPPMVCGLRYFTSLRAAWLRCKEEDVTREPPSFEDDGPLQLQQSANVGHIRDLSDGELEDLEDCLDAVQRPFPRLRRSVPLSQAVQCAENLWDTD